MTHGFWIEYEGGAHWVPQGLALCGRDGPDLSDLFSDDSIPNHPRSDVPWPDEE